MKQHEKHKYNQNGINKIHKIIIRKLEWNNCTI